MGHESSLVSGRLESMGMVIYGNFDDIEYKGECRDAREPSV